MAPTYNNTSSNPFKWSKGHLQYVLRLNLKFSATSAASLTVYNELRTVWEQRFAGQQW